MMQSSSDKEQVQNCFLIVSKSFDQNAHAEWMNNMFLSEKKTHTILLYEVNLQFLP